MTLREYVVKKLNEIDEVDEEDLSLYIQSGPDAGMPYVQFIFAEKHGEMREKYRGVPGNPKVVGVLEHGGKASLYMMIKKVGEDRWREFDILVDEKPSKVKGVLNNILNFLKDAHGKIQSVNDAALKEFIQKIIDTERRVKEGGLLIAAYINYLERKVRDLEEVIPRGWGGLVLQLMVMYFLHRRAGESIEDMRFEIFEAYEQYKKGETEISGDGFELWDMLGRDLERFSHFSRDSLFTLEDYEKLEKKGKKVNNEIFLGKKESLRSFRYENIKQVLKKFDRAIFGKEFGKVQSELWKKFEGLGILPLFEVRRWYESGLIGDIVGGVYEGIKKIEERKKGGIYYTPRFVVEYIVDNTLGPYVDEICNRLGYGSFTTLMEEGSVEDLKKFYDELRKIKVLDPACGTGHFLIYAMEKLTQYYWELWKRVSTEKRGNFAVDILSKSERKEVHLWELGADEIPFVVRLHLILRNNIYGVDIDDYAHLIAKTRMLIEVFWNYNPKVKEKGYVMPNLEMNIKTGNSLIGFASWGEVPKEEQKVIQKTLFDDFGKGESKIQKIKRLMRKAKETGNTKEYDAIIKEVRGLMNDVFVEHLGGKGVHIEKEQLGYDEGGLRAFHWIIEFPDVFEGDNPGFDSVVGNPPYVSNWSLSKTNRFIVVTYERIFDEVTTGHWDVYILFVYRATNLLKKKGLNSFILSASFGKEKYGTAIRNLLVRNYFIHQLVDFGEYRVFEEVARQYMIYVVSNEYPTPNKKTTIINYNKGKFQRISSINQFEFLNFSNVTFRTNVNEVDINIKKQIDRGSLRLGEICCVNVGIVSHSKKDSPIKFKKDDVIHKSHKPGFKRFLQGRDIDRYKIEWSGFYIDYESKRDYFHRPKFPELFETNKIIVRRISGQGNKIISQYDNFGFYSNDNFIFCTIWTKEIIKKQKPPPGYKIHKDSSKYALQYIAVLLNSKMMWYYFSKFISTDTLQSDYTGIYPEDVRKLPIKKLDHIDQELFDYLVNYLSFLSHVNQRFFEYFDKIADFLVYELYFREKFYEDGLYPEAKNYLLEAVAKHLKPIDYDRWAELYWKKQIEGELSEEEEKELQELEEKNLKTIEEVYRELSEDEEVNKWVEKIKSHPWVRVIDGGGENA